VILQTFETVYLVHYGKRASYGPNRSPLLTVPESFSASNVPDRFLSFPSVSLSLGQQDFRST
jgi:hypothetical protein